LGSQCRGEALMEAQGRVSVGWERGGPVESGAEPVVTVGFENPRGEEER
jgi:hypothetical protein